MKTYTQSLRAAFRSAWRLLEQIEAATNGLHEDDAPVAKIAGSIANLAEMRHLLAVCPGTDPEPIGPSTPLSMLKGPHPLAGGSEHELVGDFELYDHYRDTLQPVAGWAGYRTRPDGSIEWVAPGRWISRVPGLKAELCGSVLDLGLAWYLTSYAECLDGSMPHEERERVAALLESAGREPEHYPKGEAGCRTSGKIRPHRERVLETADGTLTWNPVVLAALVRDLGLVIDPEILRVLKSGDELVRS